MANTLPPRTRQRPTPRKRKTQRKRKAQRTSTRARQIIVLSAVALIGLTIIHGLSFRGDVAPGVRVGGIDLGGLSPEDAKALIHQQLSPKLDRTITVRLDQQSAEMVPADLGATIDTTQTVAIAMRTGRLRSLLLPFIYSSDLRPVIATPTRPRIPATLRAIAKPARSARVRISHGEATVTPARTGYSISARMLLHATAVAALAGQSRITLKSTVTQPAISTAEAKSAAAKALKIVSSPVALNANGNRIGALSTRTLQAAVIVRNENGKATIAFDPDALQPAIGAVLGKRIGDAQNAIWETNGERAWVIPAKAGVGFNPRAAADAVRDAALAGGIRQAEITLTAIAPRRTTADAEAYGITTKVAGAITELGDSSGNRLHNVALMAQILDNRLVLPGETFSFNAAVGPRSPERGYLEGLAIVNGLMIPSIGGGVCQVTSTLYHAVFATGLQIVDRRNHSFFIPAYGLGMDATVSWSDIDFKFRNNTEHPLLIRATADASTMLVNLYSAPPDGRVVSTSASDRYDVKPPETRYFEDPFAPAKQVIKYVDGQEGFAVDVTRHVLLNGETLSHDVFVSTYASQPVTYIVGPGAYPPGDNVFEAPPFGWVSPYDQTPPT